MTYSENMPGEPFDDIDAYYMVAPLDGIPRADLEQLVGDLTEIGARELNSAALAVAGMLQHALNIVPVIDGVVDFSDEFWDEMNSYDDFTDP